jgi:transcriptional regulator with XRE-family HTH domain
MNIQQRRLEKEWSQDQLARYSGLSTRTIQRIESGQKVGLESLKCLAAVFEISANTLV